MFSHKRAKLTLFTALLFLVLSGFAASVTIVRLYLSESWVRHTYAIEVALGDLGSVLAVVGGDRLAYLDSPTDKVLRDFKQATQRVTPAVAKICLLTSDNSSQRALCEQLEQNAQRRVAPSIESVKLVKQHSGSPMEQMELTAEVGTRAIETAAIEQQMRDNEDVLLAQRTRLTNTLFVVASAILIVAFLSSATMFAIHNRMLQGELRERESAEQQLRELSVQLLRVKDEEARRFARELHDGLGQTMVAAQILTETLQSAQPGNETIEELAKLVHEVVIQTRTISYLLHPPMLEELGFASAAEWLIQGFSQRTGITVTAEVSLDDEKLPTNLDVTLFRILQEALTNIHRHSGSRTADVSIIETLGEVIVRVKDEGKGMSTEMIANLKNRGCVGLAGMKERVTEFNGVFKIQSDASGTTIFASVPVVAERGLKHSPISVC